MSLRKRLRVETRPSHDIVDAAFAGHDISEYDGYVRFLLAHLDALQTLARGGCPGNKVVIDAEIAPLMANLQTDLTAIVGHWPVACAMTCRRFHPIALRYVLLGSRMGMAVLRKTWARADDPRVLAASHFLDTPKEPDQWRLFCIELENLPATGAVADQIIADAQAVFSIYAQSAEDIAVYIQGPPYETLLSPTAVASA